MFDTAPSYGASEEVAGRIAGELGITDKVFWATKVNVAPRGGGSADPAAAKAQIEASFAKLKKSKIDLIQVHNIGDVPTQLGILKEMKKAGRVRYIGVTSTNKGQYAELQTVMRNEPLDFIGVDYAIDNRDVEETHPAAGAGAEDRRARVRPLRPHAPVQARRRPGPCPTGRRSFGAQTWAQFFLKYVIGHPGGDVRHAGDQPGQEHGRQPRRRPRSLPDEATRKKMAQFIETLPTA